MKHIAFKLWIAFIFGWLLTSICPAEDKLPNVVYIFADDLGYGDLGCYGATKVQTPNIDRLAAQGKRFTDAHSVSAVCTPSRYALLTGQYPVRANGGSGVWGPLPVTSPLIVDTEAFTIADVFKNRGYDTAAFGKWHLGFGEGTNKWNQPLRPGPQDLGFDHYFGMPIVNSSSPFVYVENDRVVGSDPDDPLVHVGNKAKDTTPITPIPPEAGRRSSNQFKGAVKAHTLFNDYEVGTTLAKKSVEWIEEHKDKPFFMYLATTNIHHPFTPAKRFQGTSQCGLYGDFIHELDWIVGEVLTCLKDNGLSENTLVIFTSDNGGMFNIGGQAAFEAGHRLNGDLLGFKFGVWEGGHRVPMIARWPGKVEAGTTSSQLLGNVDMLATFAALTEQTLDKNQRADSVNMLPAIVGTPEEPIRDNLILAPRKKDHLSIRHGKWMYIPKRGSGGFGGKKPGEHAFSGPPAASYIGSVNSDIKDGKIRKDAPSAQLYDLESDLNQTQNVIAQHPDVVNELESILASYAPNDKQANKAATKSKLPPADKLVTKRSRKPNQKPNFVVIFADDLGYGDISCYHPKGVETPNINAIADKGIRCTDFFVPANVCSPSRAALLTGRYPMRCGIPVARFENSNSKYGDYGLLPDEITIPELLKPAGYRSLMVGKWHLGMEVEGSHPIDAGFDEYLGIPSNYGKNRGINYNTLYRGKNVDQKNVPLQELTKRYTDEAVSFINNQKDGPFFIYVSHHIVHSPLKPRKEFAGKSSKGKYGDFVLELDHSTGRIMQALRDAGVEDNTLVVFTSDNGPTRFGSTGGMNGGKYCTMEGGHRVPGIFYWPGKIAPGRVTDLTMTSMDLLPMFCKLAGVRTPQDRTIDGQNTFPILMGKQTQSPHQFLYYYNGTNLQAVREGNWKLHLPRTTKDQPFWSKKKDKTKGFVTLNENRLYNLQDDLAEKQDLASKNPSVIERLLKQAEKIRSELGDVRTTGTDQRAINLVDPQER